ncbi:flagellar associated [Chlorella sorokiniana]|uniref:Flagellar associated n=1 Tax=Chlorella sorokiniana TaxID=3076 RepID=A0A2P6TUM0_CHLSO|nr:flagellar associated [Chlorella sorokiniana]|eukprot:PRW57768.1 flagellar associated [Chlorella sorokiniana]
MWNGLRTQEALEGGVFSRRQPLSVGTTEEPVPYSSKLEDRDSYKGKQFSVSPTKPEPFKPLFEGEQFIDRLPYRELQPEKPGKGFMTSDYSKRDEFSLTVRMEQHREIIKHEARVQKEAEAKLAAAHGGASSGASGSAAEQQAGCNGSPGRKADGKLLFDLVYEGEAELCIKAKRDTRNPTALSPERKLGPYSTTARTSHTAPPAVSPPRYGIKRVDFT